MNPDHPSGKPFRSQMATELGEEIRALSPDEIEVK